MLLFSVEYSGKGQVTEKKKRRAQKGDDVASSDDDDEDDDAAKDDVSDAAKDAIESINLKAEVRSQHWLFRGSYILNSTLGGEI